METLPEYKANRIAIGHLRHDGTRISASSGKLITSFSMTIETLLFVGSTIDGRPRSDTNNRVGGDTL